MKIYRAIVEYNNGDHYEWERWFTEESPWYTERSLAEKHIDTLKQFRDYFLNKHIGEPRYTCLEPKIEEQDVMSEFSPLKFKYNNTREDTFKPLEYINYEGRLEITQTILNAVYGTWVIYLTLDNKETFEILFTHSKGVANHSYRKSNDKDSKYYQYTTKSRDEISQVINEFANKIMPMYSEFAKHDQKLGDELDKIDTEFESLSDQKERPEKRDKIWIDWRIARAKAVIKLLKQFPEFKLSDSTIRELNLELGFGYLNPEHQNIINAIKEFNFKETI